MTNTDKQKLKITLIKSSISRPGKQKAVLAGLGLKKLHHAVERENSPQIRGMISKISHLITVEEV